MSALPVGCLALWAQWAVWGCVPAPGERSQCSSALARLRLEGPPQEHCAFDSYDCSYDTPSALCPSYRSPGTHEGCVHCWLWDIFKWLLCIILIVLGSHLDLSKFSSRSAHALVGQFAMSFQLFHRLVRISGLFLCRSRVFTPLPQLSLKFLQRWNEE